MTDETYTVRVVTTISEIEVFHAIAEAMERLGERLGYEGLEPYAIDVVNGSGETVVAYSYEPNEPSES